MRTRAAAIRAGAVLRPLEEILELLHKLFLLLLLVHRFKSMKRRHPDKVTLGAAAASSLGSCKCGPHPTRLIMARPERLARPS